VKQADDFVKELAGQIAAALRRRAPKFKKHRLGAVALETAPWHKAMGLAVLIETDQVRKWYMGDWKHQEFVEMVNSRSIQQGYARLQDPKQEGSRRFVPFFQACARALCDKSVQAALELYKLDADFELFVGDPDDPNDANYCDAILGVDKGKRKAKTEIVDDLDEALKDPESVLVLKYWYHGKLTKQADAKISRLTNLQVLYLISMGLKELPACMTRLTKLEELHLDDNRLASLTGLDALGSLRLLSLRENGALNARMAAAISKMASLKQLRVGNCGLKKVPEAWQRLSALEELLVFDNPLCEIPDWLPALPGLKRLGLVDAADDRTKARIRKRHPHLEIW
jgi:hypothetical protein